MSLIEKKKFKEILDDPVLWAKAFVKTFDPVIKKITPWAARWYQVEMLRDQSLRKVARCGRRTGKCLPGWVRIFDPNTGRLVTIKELYEKQEASVLTMTENHKIEATNTDIVLDNGVKEVFKVKLKSGKEIDATGNHPLYTINGWVEINDLKVGQRIATPREMKYFGNKTENKEKIKLLAYMIGDGNCLNGNLRYTVKDETIFNEMNKVVDYFGCKLKHYESSKEYDYGIVKKEDMHNKTVKNEVKEYLEKMSVYGKGAHDKCVPDLIFELKQDLISLFLSRLYATDGWASSRTEPKNMSEIGYCSVSQQLVLDVQHLLLRFGIKSYIQTKRVKYNGGINIAYQLFIYSKDGINKFYDQIGIYSKEEALKKAVDIANLHYDQDDSIPAEIMQEVDLERQKLGLKKKDLCMSKNDRLRMNYAPQRSTIHHYGKVMNSERLIGLGESDIYWDEIASIESIGDHQTYDLTIPGTHNFVANDIIVHNTEVMCIDSLHKTYTKPKFRVLFITPYENQVRLIFMRLRELIDMSPMLKQEVIKITSNPFQIVWKNGGAIMGFTTGASSGSGGASVTKQY